MFFSLNELQTHSQAPPVNEVRNIELNINNKQLITVNTHLLCLHSDYFKTLFNGPFFERNQTVISIHLPEIISIESFIYLIDLLNNNDEIIQLNHIKDLLHLCDNYLFDYIPYQLVYYILKQFQNGINLNLADIIDIVSKPHLISSLIRALFSHLLTNKKNLSIEIFSTLMIKYSNELQTLIQSFLKHKCWFHDEFSPFLS